MPDFDSACPLQLINPPSMYLSRSTRSGWYDRRTSTNARRRRRGGRRDDTDTSHLSDTAAAQVKAATRALEKHKATIRRHLSTIVPLKV